MSEPLQYLTLPVLSNDEIAPNNFVLQINSPEMARLAQPGQFAMLKPVGGSTLLARPYSFFKRERDRLFFLYKVYGKGSRELSLMKRGSLVTVLGPLGQGFRPSRMRHWYFVAGGIGVAPFLFLAGEAAKNVEMTLFFGVKTKDQAILEDEFKALGCEVIFVTEDATWGSSGLATDFFESFLRGRVGGKISRRSSPVEAEIFCCGPRPMEFQAARIAIKNKIPCQIAFEEYMGCGFGTCMGCVVKCRRGSDWVYERVCREGPVFGADEIVWEGNG